MKIFYRKKTRLKMHCQNQINMWHIYVCNIHSLDNFRKECQSLNMLANFSSYAKNIFCLFAFFSEITAAGLILFISFFSLTILWLLTLPGFVPCRHNREAYVWQLQSLRLYKNCASFSVKMISYLSLFLIQ